jgi:predicted nucleic acid-binding protein
VSRIVLLDVNVLIALIDSRHESHRLARTWFLGERQIRWATCPLTENGVVRILSGSGYRKRRHFSAPQVLQLLRYFCRRPAIPSGQTT